MECPRRHVGPPEIRADRTPIALLCSGLWSKAAVVRCQGLLVPAIRASVHGWRTVIKPGSSRRSFAVSVWWWLVIVVVVIAVVAVVLFVVRRARRAGSVLASRVSDRGGQ